MPSKRNHWMYGLSGALLLIEAAIFAAALFPSVTPEYRAYYLDRSTDCYPLPVSGAYRLGDRVSFGAASEGKRVDLARCGWRDPEARGSWSDGNRSMLRFAIAPPPADLVLQLSVQPYLDAETPRQRIEVTANGTPLETFELVEKSPAIHRISVPSDIVGTTGWLDITLNYPDARPLTAAGSGTRYYAVFVLDVGLMGAVD